MITSSYNQMSIELQKATSSAKILKDKLIEKSALRRRNTVQNVWNVALEFVNKGQKVTASKVGRICEERFDGPKIQTIRNDKEGLLAMLKLLQGAQAELQSNNLRKSNSPKGSNELEQLLSSVGEPRLRAMIRHVFDENSALKMEVRLLRGFYNKIEAGQFSMVAPSNESVVTPSNDNPVAALSQDDRRAIMVFLNNDVLFDLGLKLEAGEVRTVNGRTVFPRDAVTALRTISGLAEDV